ncbi:MAG: hypothetical protein QM695_11120 [Micropruina sp.]
MKRVLTAAVAAALGFALVGCSGTAPEPTPSASGAAVDPARVSPTNLPVPPMVKDPQGAISDLTLGECATKPGEQKVKGTLTSSQKASADFLVTISWTTATGDVMGRGFTVVKGLAPGATKKFTITAKVAPGAVQCVKGVEFGTIKS